MELLFMSIAKVSLFINFEMLALLYFSSFKRAIFVQIYYLNKTVYLIFVRLSVTMH
jgi:hypothetical protein